MRGVGIEGKRGARRKVTSGVFCKCFSPFFFLFGIHDGNFSEILGMKAT